MRIGVIARLLQGPSLRGWNRYTVNLLENLAALDVELILYTMGPIHAVHRQRLQSSRIEMRVATPRRLINWEHVWLPRQCRADAIDVLHGPFNFGLPWNAPCPMVLTLHDAIDQVYVIPKIKLSDRLRPGAMMSRWSHWLSRTRARTILTVSEHSKQDLIKYLGLPERRVAVVHEAADPVFHEPISEAQRREILVHHQLNRPYFFYVGGWEGRKNVPFLLKAFAAAAETVEDVELVLAGGKHEEIETLHRLAAALGVADRLRLIGWVDDTELPALYASAQAFVYPSEYEGFGLQLLEAMACGCPTLAARATSLPEVLGPGGETFSLDATTELTALLRRTACDPGFRASLSVRAREREAEFSWERAAIATLAVYRDTIAAAGRPRRDR